MKMTMEVSWLTHILYIYSPKPPFLVDFDGELESLSTIIMASVCISPSQKVY